MILSVGYLGLLGSERSHVFNVRRALKDRSASEELAGDSESSLCSFSTAGCTLHL